MLDLFHFFKNGFFITPLVHSRTAQNLFGELEKNGFQALADLEKTFNLRSGKIAAILKLFNEQSIFYSDEKGTYRSSELINKPLNQIDIAALYAVKYPANEADTLLKGVIEQVFDENMMLEDQTIHALQAGVLVFLWARLQNDDGNAFHQISCLAGSATEVIIRYLVKLNLWSIEDNAFSESGVEFVSHPDWVLLTQFAPQVLTLCEQAFKSPNCGSIDNDKKDIASSAFLNNTAILAWLNGVISPYAEPMTAFAYGSIYQALKPICKEKNISLRNTTELFQSFDGGKNISNSLQAIVEKEFPADYSFGLDVIGKWISLFGYLADTLPQKGSFLFVGQHSYPLSLQRHLDEPLHFIWRDFLGFLADDDSISAEAMVMLAANTGLFNEHPFGIFPQDIFCSRISLHFFSKRDYRIRYAQPEDLNRLDDLEKMCWQHTQTPKFQLQARIEKYPQGQLVLEKEGEVVGVIYSQRIAHSDDIDNCTAADVHLIHQQDGTVIQLLAVNIDPGVQNLGYGDQLLEFMLQLASVVPGVNEVVGVTLCKNFNIEPGISFSDYIYRTGMQQDAVLAFHYAHGANIVKPIENYRPEDRANLHYGVLVSYDPKRRVPRTHTIDFKVQADNAFNLSRDEVSSFVQKQIQQIGIPENEYHSDRPLMEMGLDSADLMQLQKQFTTHFQKKFPAAFFFEYNTANKIINFLCSKLDQADVVSSQIAAPETVSFSRDSFATTESFQKKITGKTSPISEKDIAIIGMSCRLPGGIETLDDFWQALASGESKIGKYPKYRGGWPSGKDMPGIDQGGFLTDIDAFDSEFFRISPVEARIIDPQQRILLELAWACLEDAAILPSALKGSNTGVFIGASNCDYSRLIKESGIEVAAHHGVGSSLAVLANRISYFFDFCGPSLLVDTACSASLVALHTAVKSLHAEECGVALVGGVNVICDPDLSIAYHKAGMLSHDARCKTFDDSANGYVRSEGGGMILLKPLLQAIADGNQIHAVIKGSSVNHGGLAGGLTVPNPQKQSELLTAAWKNAGILPTELSYIEAHGTGTSLGDPIEIRGIRMAYGNLGLESGGVASCAIGSVKTNLGHLESAAGITGLLKVVLAMKHGQIPATINYHQLNSKIDLAGSQLYIADNFQPWSSERVRYAGISSFGSGGANAHVVVQEYIPVENAVEPASRPNLFVLSAANAECLNNYAVKVLAWLKSGHRHLSFTDALYTWQVGRTPMKCRLAIRANDFDDLLVKLEQWLDAGTDTSDIWSASFTTKDVNALRLWHTQSGQTLISHAMAERDFAQLAAIWICGVDISWLDIYGETKPALISVPTYSFTKSRHWIEAVPRNTFQWHHGSKEFIHPVLHTNVSNLVQHSYKTRLTGDEFFLADHQVKIEGSPKYKLLPAVVYLEMARVAVERALPGHRDTVGLELHHTIWVYPMVVDAPKDLTISLFENGSEQIGYEIFSQDGQEDRVHCQGYAVFGSGEIPPAIDINALKARMLNGEMNPTDIYQAFKNVGLHFGPAHQAITAIHQGNNELLATVQLPDVVIKNRNDYLLHPSLLDSALQASIGLVADLPSLLGDLLQQPSLPFGLELLRIVAPCTENMFAWVRFTEGQRGNKILKMDVDLCDLQGNVCVQLRGFSTRSFIYEEMDASSVGDNAANRVLAVPVWSEAESTQSEFVTFNQRHILLANMASQYHSDLRQQLPRAQVTQFAIASTSLTDRYTDWALGCFQCIQSILKSKPDGKALLQIVVTQSDEHALFEGISGLLKTVTLENPNLIAQLIFIEGETSASQLANQLDVAATQPQYTVIKHHMGQRLALTWQELKSKANPRQTMYRENGIYLITGGFGGLGQVFAKDILSRCPGCTLIFTGRSHLDDEKQKRMDSLSMLGGTLEYWPLDLADSEQVSQVLADIIDQHGGLHGIIHCAGMISDNFILKKTVEEFRQVLTPKLQGVYHLDQATQKANLDFFVLFSSFASALGNLGQSDYAAANGFMDQFAAYRNNLVDEGQRSGKCVAINWPLWRDGGMAIDDASLSMLERTIGMWPMATETGLTAFHLSLQFDQHQLLVMEGHVEQLQQSLSRPGWGEELEDALIEDTQITIDENSLVEQAQVFIRAQVSHVLKLPAAKIDPHAPLEQFGIDSILAMSLTNELEKSFGALSKTLFFEYQTLAELCGYFVANHASKLHKLLAVDPTKTSAREDRSAPRQVRNTARASTRQVNSPYGVQGARVDKTAVQNALNEPIAIIGLSGRYPNSVNINDYWKNLRDGNDCIVEVPENRWNWRQYFSDDRNAAGRHFSRWGGFIEGVDEFDPLFFNIAPREAKFIDPQERLFLQHAWMAMEDAGYTKASLQIPDEYGLSGQVGVYVGVMWGEYQLLGNQMASQDQRMGFSGNLASIANRVSYVMNLHGPSMTLDTMCSSSLTAVHSACMDLKLGRTQMAIAGGVNISVHPNKYLLLSVGQFISSHGHCQSFGEGGDGYIPGEGVGAVLLKRLSDAERDGDHIYGVIRGSALNHGGKTNGYSVPNPQAQANAIRRALRESNTDARHISYIEAHGTGTKLGDPIEIAALTQVFREYSQENGFCLVGSAKSNIGHCESAAGIAGLTKILLQLQHRKIVPSLHSQRLNPHIDFDSSPFVVNQHLRHWDAPTINGKVIPRIAGISSFGAGGANAHMIIEEYQPLPVNRPAADMVREDSRYLVPLSARTESQLQDKARDLAVHLRDHSNGLDLVDVAYTLQIGRETLDERLVIMAASVEELIERLNVFAQGNEQLDDVYRGRAKNNKESMLIINRDDDMKEAIDRWIARGKLSKLADLWVKGLEFDWGKLYGAQRPSRISLPAYPFAKERYWIDAYLTETPLPTEGVIHPLLHTNTSTLQQQGYRTRFTGNESYLAAGNSEQLAVLPVAIYLEMARAAAEDASGERPESAVLALYDLVWADPKTISGHSTLEVALFARDGNQVALEFFSKVDDQDLIHCQGLACFRELPGQPGIDIVSLRERMQDVGAIQGFDAVYRGDGQLLAELSLVPSSISSLAVTQLHPEIISRAFAAASLLYPELGFGTNPIHIKEVLVIFSCTPVMKVWIRQSGIVLPENPAYTVDIDLLDQDGNVCIQIKGVGYSLVFPTSDVVPVPGISLPVSASIPAFVPDLSRPVILVEAPVRVLFNSRVPAVERKNENYSSLLEKPTGMVLVALDQVLASRPFAALNSLPKPRFQLEVANVGQVMTEVPTSSVASDEVQLWSRGRGIYALEIRTRQANLLDEALIQTLIAAFKTLSSRDDIKALMLIGDETTFLQGGREHYNLGVQQQLFATVAAFDYPIIAVMQGSSQGAGFVLGSLCDLMVLNEIGQYGVVHADSNFYPNNELDILLAKRFGSANSFYSASSASGTEWHQRGWSGAVLPADQMHSYASSLAGLLSNHSHLALRLLKKRLTKELGHCATALVPIEWHSTAPVIAAIPNQWISGRSISVTAYPHAVLHIEISATASSGNILSDLSELLTLLHQTSLCRVVVLSSQCKDFLPTDTDSGLLITLIREKIMTLSIPFISAIHNAQSSGWLFALTSDLCIYDAKGVFSVDSVLANPQLAQLATLTLPCHFPETLAQEILLTGAAYNADVLLQRDVSVIVANDNKLLDVALQQAQKWGHFPVGVLEGRKLRRNRMLLEQLTTPWHWSSSVQHPLTVSAVGTLIPLQSTVIQATTHPNGVVHISMQDRASKNMFSEAFVEGMHEIFGHIAGDEHYKVVVLTGHEGYFATGGTRETLLDIHAGKSKFTDDKVFELPRQCALPVIAAIDGHGIGAGWALGMFADVVILAEESHYRSPYMQYGFTPGAGSTLVFPQKIGMDLATETLLTAQSITGRSLKQRGVKLRVLPKSAIPDAAMALANQIAGQSRDALVHIKRYWMQSQQAMLEESYLVELAMHEQTFVGQASTLEKIQALFAAPEQRAAQTSVVSISPVQSVPPHVRTGTAGTDVALLLRSLLAQELHLQESDIDDHTQFVELGLDSISGVTWIRKINEHYDTQIEATKVYSYPTLVQLSAYVREIAGINSTVVTHVAGSDSTSPSPVLHQPPVVETPATHAPVTQVPVMATSVSLQQGQLQNINSELKTLLAQELFLQESDIDDNSQFVDLGLDSISGVTWIRKINERYGIEIEATKVYSYPTMAQLSRYVAEQVPTPVERPLPVLPPAKVVASAPLISAIPLPPPVRQIAHSGNNHNAQKLQSLRYKAGPKIMGASYHSEAIAIVGMAGQFPQATNVDSFWKNLAEGKNCISQVAPKRWDMKQFYQTGNSASGKTNSQWMGALEDYDLFDPLFFNISPTEAENMDPQQRLFLQACWHAIEHGGYSAKSLFGSKCGVFVGVGAGDYHQLSPAQRWSAQGFTGSATSILAARISYFLNLQGPCVSIDTACSSSLVAMAQACDSLLTGSCDMALAGGVYVAATPEMHIKTAQSGMLSANGSCFTFDQRANGFVIGEAVGVVMLKRLSDAERDQDNILGVIEGWGVNQDGKTNGITAPNPESQTRLEQDVYRRFNINPAEIQLVEAHGTGTKLGDPIEVEALKNAFRGFTDKTQYCALGSVKSNIGHCLTAAGVAGVIKLLLSFKHRQLPPTIHFEQLNEHIGLDGSPFYVNDRLQPWEVEPHQTRRAAISSFGFSGTNAHVVLREYVMPERSVSLPGAQLIPLSARNDEQLQRKVAELLAFIQATPGVKLADMGYTLQLGREPMEERLGVVANSMAELEEKLQALLQGNTGVADVYRGQVKSNKEGMQLLSQDIDLRETLIEKWVKEGKWGKLLGLWVKGLDLDWHKLYGSTKPQRIALPLYPFARERYWLEESSSASVAGIGATGLSVLHPLVHQNTSTLYQQRFTSHFSGNEFFLKDHQVRLNEQGSQRVLPGVAYLEMARVALQQALPDIDDSHILVMRNVIWAKPLTVNTIDRQVHIALFNGEGSGDAHKVDFEIYSDAGNESLLHCQGQGEFVASESQQHCDLELLKLEMHKNRLDPDTIYKAFDNMGLFYGEAHRGLVALYQGQGQLVADLHLPQTLLPDFPAYHMHPSLLDCALQASLGLLIDLQSPPGYPWIPFALETLYLFAPCEEEMVVWVRRAGDVVKTPGMVKLDLDLCTPDGNVCVRMNGFSLRALQEQGKTGTRIPQQSVAEEANGFDRSFYENLIKGILEDDISIEEAAKLG